MAKKSTPPGKTANGIIFVLDWAIELRLLFSVKKGNIADAEQSFKDAAVLADQVVDDIAKNVIQTQLAQIQKFNEKQTEVKVDSNNESK